MFKKAQTGGLVIGLVFGIASLIIAVIIAFIIVSTLMDANLLTSGRDSVTATAERTFINITGDALAGASNSRFLSGSIAVVSISGNATDDSLNNTAITAGNYSISAAGLITNLTGLVWNEVDITYTYTLKNEEEISADAMDANFTAGVDNVSAKIPTVLLVAAIVLILGVLALLVGAWQRMRIGGGSI